MNGAQEVPLHTTAAAGTCTATVDEATGNVTFGGSFSGLSAPASAATLRGLAGAGGTAPALLKQTTVTTGVSGTFSGSGTLTAPLLGGIVSGQAYCEIADAAFPSGEIRGQLAVPVPVPALAPGAFSLLAAALGAAGILALRNGARAPWRSAKERRA